MVGGADITLCFPARGLPHSGSKGLFSAPLLTPKAQRRSTPSERTELREARPSVRKNNFLPREPASVKPVGCGPPFASRADTVSKPVGGLNLPREPLYAADQLK